MIQGFDEVLEKLRSHPAFCICLDFDGTLVPIESRPEMCWLSWLQRDLLRSLATHPTARVAIVTGRGLDDIQTRVGVSEIIYAANHGLEIQGMAEEFQIERATHIRQSLPTLLAPLSSKLSDVTGCWIENKGLTATVHYRLVNDREIPLVSKVVHEHLNHWPEFIVRSGKSVLEIRPRVDWNKSHAVRWIAERAFPGIPAPYVIFCGDDVTDHDVFRDLPNALTIQVGDCHDLSAKCRVPDPDELWYFLRLLEAVLYERIL